MHCCLWVGIVAQHLDKTHWNKLQFRICLQVKFAMGKNTEIDNHYENQSPTEQLTGFECWASDNEITNKIDWLVGGHTE